MRAAPIIAANAVAARIVLQRLQMKYRIIAVKVALRLTARRKHAGALEAKGIHRDARRRAAAVEAEAKAASESRRRRIPLGARRAKGHQAELAVCEDGAAIAKHGAAIGEHPRNRAA